MKYQGGPHGIYDSDRAKPWAMMPIVILVLVGVGLLLFVAFMSGNRGSGGATSDVDQYGRKIRR